VVRGTEDVMQQLDDHIVMTQSMAFSPFKRAFEERIAKWSSKLSLVSDVLEQWLACQRSWLYLEPIFASDDINRQLPVEGKRCVIDFVFVFFR
jgi:dynein heavy chain